MIRSRPPGTTPAQADNGKHGPAAGFGAIVPAERLLAVRAQSVGEAVPGEAGGPPQAVQALHEVRGQHAGAVEEGSSGDEEYRPAPVENRGRATPGRRCAR